MLPRFVAFALIFLIGTGASIAQAQNATVTLQWDPPADTTTITEYHLYVRSPTGSYVEPFYTATGPTTNSLTISNLPAGSYFFVAKSFDGTQESDPSLETSATSVHVALEGSTAAQLNGKSVNAQVFNAPNGTTAAFASSSTANASGIITIPTGAAGVPTTFDIRLKASGYLAKRIVNYNRNSPTTVSLLAGDLDDSGIINSFDYASIKTNWFTSNATADINRDGIVNSSDYGYLKKNWFLTDDL